MQRAKIAKGTPVTIEITADADNEVHIHGCDLQQEVGPAKLAKFSFSADLAGVFEVELHDGKRKILELDVK